MSSLSRASLLLFLMVFSPSVACQSETQTPLRAKVVEPTKTKKQAASRVQPVNNKAVRAFLDMERVAGGKRSQVTTLTTSTDTYLIGYRPIPKYYAFVEKYVMVEFEEYFPEGQALSGKHARVKSIALAPDETPHNPTPTALPAPPIITTKAQLLKRIDRWVQFDASIIKSYAPKNDSRWRNVHLNGPDGVVIRTTVSQTYFDRAWKAQPKLTFVGTLSKPSSPTTDYLKKQRAEIDKALGTFELQLSGSLCEKGGYSTSNVNIEGPTCIKGPNTNSIKKPSPKPKKTP